MRERGWGVVGGNVAWIKGPILDEGRMGGGRENVALMQRPILDGGRMGVVAVNV